MSYNQEIKKIDEQAALLSIEKNLLLEKQLTSKDPNDIFKAQSYLQELEANKKKKDIRSFLFDPFDAYYTTNGYKQQRKRVSFDVLKKVGDTPVVGSVINTRVFQLQNFLRFTDNNKEEGYIIRKKRSIFDKKSNESNKEERVKIEYIVNFLENGGLKSKWDINDDLHDFVRKIMRDSLTYDQLAAECERNRRFDLIGMTAIDASTIRILETVDPRFRELSKQRYTEQFGQLPRYAQVYQSNVMKNPFTQEDIVFYPWELMYAQRNKSTALDKNGYGTSEIEILLDIITWSLWGMQYNGNFFKQGSNPKGFINLKDGGANMDVVNDFRQTWRQMLAGVNNCVHGDTNIITSEGSVKIGDLFLTDSSDKFIRIWDGEEFVDGRAYKSGKKQLTSMKLNNGVEIKTSPNHRFSVIDETIGTPVWKERKDIKLGDYVLVNKNSVKSESEPLYYKGKLVEEDLFEFLGWAVGDGWFGENNPKDRGLSTFYHSIKEPWILERHSEILKKYNINHKTYEIFYTEKEKTYCKERYGFKTVADSHIYIEVFDAEFIKFVYSLGFTSSKKGKVIPQFLYSFDGDCKRSFIKGFFSADGSTEGGRQVCMSITRDSLREETKLLLMTEGIRCSEQEGKANFSSNNFGVLPKDGYLLTLKDNREYFDKIGMLQPHKQYKENKTKSYSILNVTPVSTAKFVGKIIRDKCNKDSISITPREREFLSEVICGNCATMIKICDLAKKYEIELPDFVTNYNFAKVVSLAEFDEEVEMYDVEMFNEKHYFIANGIQNHNSHKIPVFSGIDLEWIDLQSNNRDMEFQQWMEFLIIMICSVFTIDPSELGYQFQKQAQIFGQTGQKERIQHSKKKGLKPLLLFLEKVLTKWIVSEIDKDYELIFTGIDNSDEAEIVDLITKKIAAGTVSFESAFEAEMGRKYNPKTDTILNPVFLQAQQLKQYGGEGSNGMVDDMTGESGEGVQNPFDKFNMDQQGAGQFAKSVDSDPILLECLKYVDDNLNVK